MVCRRHQSFPLFLAVVMILLATFLTTADSKPAKPKSKQVDEKSKSAASKSTENPKAPSSTEAPADADRNRNPTANNTSSSIEKPAVEVIIPTEPPTSNENPETTTIRRTTTKPAASEEITETTPLTTKKATKEATTPPASGEDSETSKTTKLHKTTTQTDETPSSTEDRETSKTSRLHKTTTTAIVEEDVTTATEKVVPPTTQAQRNIAVPAPETTPDPGVVLLNSFLEGLIGDRSFRPFLADNPISRQLATLLRDQQRLAAAAPVVPAYRPKQPIPQDDQPSFPTHEPPKVEATSKSEGKPAKGAEPSLLPASPSGAIGATQPAASQPADEAKAKELLLRLLQSAAAPVGPAPLNSAAAAIFPNLAAAQPANGGILQKVAEAPKTWFDGTIFSSADHAAGPSSGGFIGALFRTLFGTNSFPALNLKGENADLSSLLRALNDQNLPIQLKNRLRQ